MRETTRRLSLTLLLLAACDKPPTAETTATPDEAQAQAPEEPIAIYDELEALIEQGKGSDDARKDALDRIQAVQDDGSAQYAFVRAAITGRVAELRGVKAGKLVTQAESWAQKSIERDPEYRDRAAKRMLGTLWVLAPPRLIEHGDSESGLEMLEELAEAQPDIAQNHLRVAEAYVALGDPDPAVEFLCRAQAGVDQLRRDERELLDRIIEEVTDGQELSCDAPPAS